MKRKPLLWTLAGVILLAIVLLVRPTGPREPVYQGKKLSQWIDGTAAGFITGPNPPDKETSDRADAAIRALGTNALPWLLYEFTCPDSKWKRKVDSWIAGHTRWDFRLSDHANRMYRAYCGLVTLGPGMAPALPELAKCLDYPDQFRMTFFVLENHKEKAVPHFAARVDPINPLGSPKSTDCFGILKSWARNADPAVRLAASNAVFKITNALPATPAR